MSQTNNKYKRLEALLSEAKPADPNPPSQPANGEMDALKVKVALLEIELEENRAKSQSNTTSFVPVSASLEAKPVLSGASTVKGLAQTAKKSRLPKFLSAPVFDGDAEKTRAAKLLHQITMAIWALPVLAIIVSILNPSTIPFVFPAGLVVTISLIILMALNRAGKVNLASNLLVGMLVAIFTYLDYATAGTRTALVLLSVVTISMSGLLLGRRAPIIVAIVIAGQHAVMLALNVYGLIEVQDIQPKLLQTIIVTTSAYLLIGFTFQLAITRLQFVLNQVQEDETELQIRNRELQDFSRSLEQRVFDRTHDLELASEVGRTIAEKVENVYDMLSEATEMIRSRFNLYYTQVYLLDASGRSITLRAGTGEVGKQLLQRGHHLVVSSGSLNGRAVFEKKPVIVADTTRDGTFLSNPLLPKTRSEMAIPLLVGNKILGVLDMQSDLPGALNQDNLPAFQTLAGQLSVAIQNATLFTESEEARKQVEANVGKVKEAGWQEFLNGVDRSERIGYVFDQRGVLPLIEAQTSEQDNALIVPIEVTGAKVGEIRLTDEPNRKWTESEKQLVEAATVRAAQHIENLRLLAQAEQYRAEAEQVSKRLTREGWESYLQTRGQLAEGYAYDLNNVQKVTTSNNGHKSSDLAHPLTVRDEIIGQFTIDANDALSQEMNEIVLAVATQLGDQIERLRLSEQNEKRAYELATVATVSTTASTVLNPDELLQAVVNLTKERFDLYHAHIYLADESWNTLLLAAGAGEVGKQMVAGGHSISLDVEKSLVARAAREQQAIIVNDVRTEPDFLPNPLLPETRAEMAVPMIVGDKVLGVFDVQSGNAGGFSKEDANIYTTLAAQVAVALQNARLYVEQSATVTQLRELDRLKSSFLANMSHELRTPLNSILGFADVMLEELDGPLTENMNNDLGLIQKNGQHLLHLINDVLDMAKIEAGKMNLNVEKFNLHSIIEEVTNITSSLAGEKSLLLFIEKDSDHDVEIYADRTRLRQVMINIVNNAMKFTEKGKVAIRAIHEDNHVLISVKDTGMGIPPELLESVFQEFTQVDATSTRKVGGTGLGLPISRRLIEMHGGRIWAESTGIEGEGTVLHVSLPIESKVVESETVTKN